MEVRAVTGRTHAEPIVHIPDHAARDFYELADRFAAEANVRAFAAAPDAPVRMLLPPSLVAMYGAEQVAEAVRQVEASMFPLSGRRIEALELGLSRDTSAALRSAGGTPPLDPDARADHWRAVITKEMGL